MKQLALHILVMIVVAGCGPKESTTETSTGCMPRLLSLEPGPEKLAVAWKPTCDDLIAGYNIYVFAESIEDEWQDGADGSTDPVALESAALINETPFPGDTEPEDGIEHYEVPNLDPGVRYFVWVRTVFPDRSLSNRSIELSEGTGFTGEITLPVRYASEEDGFSLVDGKHVKSKDLANDLYFFNKDGIDYLNSPTRLDGFLRESRLKVLKVKGDYKQVRKMLLTSMSAPSEDKIEIRKNDWVHLRTADNGNAYMRVLGFKGSGEDRTVKLFVRFSSIPYPTAS